MPPFDTNLSETPMDAGTYHAEVFSTREITTKSGYPMVWVDWRIIDAGPQCGGLVPQGIAFVPQMVNRNNHLLKAMGQPYGKAVTIDPAAWEGVRCLITVGQGQKGMEVTDLDPADGGQAALPPVDHSGTAAPAGDVPF